MREAPVDYAAQFLRSQRNRAPAGPEQPVGKSQTGSVAAVWTSVLGLALVAALHPLRIGIILLMISRPRPLQNLFAYWIGSVINGVPSLLVPLMVLHFAPMFRSFAQHWINPATATGSTGRHLQIAMGVFWLSIAALTMVRSRAR